MGGIIGKVSTVTHYTAIEKQETGATFAARMKEQALQAGVEIVQAEAVHVALTGEVKSVTADRGVYEAKRIILANGGTPRKLGIPGEKELAGKGMGMNAARDGADYAGKNVYVVGGADGAVKEALYLAGFAKQVTIVHFEEQLGCIAEFRQKVAAAGNISVRLASRLHAVYGQDQVERLEIASEQDGSIETIEDPGCGIFVYAGILPNTELYTELALEGGYIPTNDKMETAIPGVYAAGDIGVVVYLDRDSDAVIAGGAEADPNTERLHSGDDAIFIGGIRTGSNTISGLPAGSPAAGPGSRRPLPRPEPGQQSSQFPLYASASNTAFIPLYVS